jgi:hypothetical protein
MKGSAKCQVPSAKYQVRSASAAVARPLPAPESANPLPYRARGEAVARPASIGVPTQAQRCRVRWRRRRPASRTPTTCCACRLLGYGGHAPRPVRERDRRAAPGRGRRGRGCAMDSEPERNSLQCVLGRKCQVPNRIGATSRHSETRKDVILSAAASLNLEAHWSRAAAEGSIAGARRPVFEAPLESWEPHLRRWDDDRAGEVGVRALPEGRAEGDGRGRRRASPRCSGVEDRGAGRGEAAGAGVRLPRLRRGARLHQPDRRDRGGGGAPPGAAHGVGARDGRLVDAQDRRPAPQRLRDGREDGRGVRKRNGSHGGHRGHGGKTPLCPL